MIQDLFLKADDDEIAELTDVNDPKDEAALRDAVRCVEEWKAYVWTKTLNSEKGVAPSTASVLQKIAESSSQMPPAVRPDFGAVSQSRGRAWARRWRRNWHGRHSKIRIREVVPVEEMRAKVGQ